MPVFKVYRHFPVHLTIGPFITELVRYIDEQVYPGRFKFKMVGPARREIQRWEEESSYQKRVLETTPLPSIVVTPVIDQPVENWFKLWHSRRLFPKLGSHMYGPLYETKDFRISYVVRRIAGHADFAIFTESYMESHDIMMAFYDQFYSLDKWIELPEITMYFAIPEDLVFYTEDGGRIIVSWENTYLRRELVKSVNQEMYLYPLKHTPYIKLSSLNDASNLYGGSDSPVIYGLNGTIDYEIELPSYLTIETDHLIKDVEITLELYSMYHSSNVYDYLNSPSFIRNNKFYSVDRRYSYVFEDAQDVGYELDLEYQYVKDNYEYIFFNSVGELIENVQYEYIDNGSKVKFLIPFKQYDIIEYIGCNVTLF